MATATPVVIISITFVLQRKIRRKDTGGGGGGGGRSIFASSCLVIVGSFCSLLLFLYFW